MAQYICNPITVDAFQITKVEFDMVGFDIQYTVTLDNSEVIALDVGKTARMQPKEGDYLVRTHKPDEYEYLNPQHVFEAKYTKLEPTTPAAEQGDE